MQADGAHLRQERQCPDCRGTDFVEDHSAGDIVCRVRRSGALELSQNGAAPRRGALQRNDTL
jgi:hypothetical protein